MGTKILNKMNGFESLVHKNNLMMYEGWNKKDNAGNTKLNERKHKKELNEKIKIKIQDKRDGNRKWKVRSLELYRLVIKLAKGFCWPRGEDAQKLSCLNCWMVMEPWAAL